MAGSRGLGTLETERRASRRSLRLTQAESPDGSFYAAAVAWRSAASRRLALWSNHVVAATSWPAATNGEISRQKRQIDRRLAAMEVQIRFLLDPKRAR